MAVMLSKRLPGVALARKVLADDEGRFLGVHVQLYGRDTLVLGCHADNGDDDEQEAYYKRVTAALRGLRAGQYDDVIIVGDWNNVEDRDADYRAMDKGGAANPRSAGVAAMRELFDAASSLLRTPAAMRDAFRTLAGTTREYTRWHRQGGTVLSRARLDRAYLPAHMLGGGLRKLKTYGISAPHPMM